MGVLVFRSRGTVGVSNALGNGQVGSVAAAAHDNDHLGGGRGDDWLDGEGGGDNLDGAESRRQPRHNLRCHRGRPRRSAAKVPLTPFPKVSLTSFLGVAAGPLTMLLLTCAFPIAALAAEPETPDVYVELAQSPICHGISASAIAQFANNEIGSEGHPGSSSWQTLATDEFGNLDQPYVWFRSVDLNGDGDPEGVVKVNHIGPDGESLLVNPDDRLPSPMQQSNGNATLKLYAGGEYVRALASRPGTIILSPSELSARAELRCLTDAPKGLIYFDTGSKFEVATLHNQTFVLVYGNAYDVPYARQLVVFRFSRDMVLTPICKFLAR